MNSYIVDCLEPQPGSFTSTLRADAHPHEHASSGWGGAPLFIHSLGNHLDVLSRLPWIRHDSCWYWGDLDRHGFTLLSRARTMTPQLESLLMGPGDIETYRPLGVKENLDRYDQPDSTLTPAEASALAALQLSDGKYLRTEQERIPVSDAERALEQARNLVQPNATETSHCVTGCRTLDLGTGGLSALPAGLRILRPQAAPCRFHGSYAASGARQTGAIRSAWPAVFAVPGCRTPHWQAWNDKPLRYSGDSASSLATLWGDDSDS